MIRTNKQEGRFRTCAGSMRRSREEEGFVVIGGNKITDTARNAEVQSERYRTDVNGLVIPPMYLRKQTG